MESDNVLLPNARQAPAPPPLLVDARAAETVKTAPAPLLVSAAEAARLRPTAWAGHARVFTESDLQFIESILHRMDTDREGSAA
jgi:hypothetical protein